MIRNGFRRARTTRHSVPVRTLNCTDFQLFQPSPGLSISIHSSLPIINAYNNASQLSATASSNSFMKMYSSKPSVEDDLKKPPPVVSSISDNANDLGVPSEKESISIFFAKRKEALAKEKRQMRQTQNQSINRDDQNKKKSGIDLSTRKNQRNGNDKSSSFHNRKNHQQNRTQHKGSNYNHNNRNKNNNVFPGGPGGTDNVNGNSVNRRVPPEGLSDAVQDLSRKWVKNPHQSSPRSRVNQSQDAYKDNESNHTYQRGNFRRNNRNNNNNNNHTNNSSSSSNRKNEHTGTNRLADMMKKLRKDSPSKFQEGRSNETLPGQFSRNNRNANQAIWRKKRFQISSRDNREDQNRNNRRRMVKGAEEFLRGPRSDDKFRENKKKDSNRVDVIDEIKVVTLPVNNSLTLIEISSLFRVKVDVIKNKLRAMGERIEGDNYGNITDDVTASSKPSINTLDIDMMELLALDLGIETVRSASEPVVVDAETILMQQRRSDKDVNDIEHISSTVDDYPARPPVVTIMGHVDHGKTTLMDALRRRSQEQQQQSKKGKASKKSKKKNTKKSTGATKNIAGTEAGGITQVISAFQVALDGNDDKITFLDTPGHAAFRTMRQSGSHAADILVLVVAADDGISEQTVEIINFYKSIVKGSSDSAISMVVAVNKIDKPGIDAEEAKMRIENQLLEHGIISEGMKSDGSELGQPVQVIPTSGITGEGLDDLIDGLLLQSEVMDLRANDQANGEGIVMDARQEKGLGIVADCIVRWGKIKKEDTIISGDHFSQVRMLKDVNNKMLKEGLPSQPVRIVGFKFLPKAGDPIMVVESEEIAKEMLLQRQAIDPSKSDRPDGPGSDVELHITGMRRHDTWRVRKYTNRAAIVKADGSVRIPIIVKADADGSLAAIRDSLLNIGKESKHTVIIDPIMEGIGEVSASDIQMAKESQATIFSFGSKRIDQAMINLAESEGVCICSNDIIYSLLDEAKDVLGAYLPLISKEHTHGRALVKAVFSIDTADGEEMVAGLNVTDGYMYQSKAPSGDSSSTSDTDSHFRVYREGGLISPTGENLTATSLRRFKEIVESARLGEECGLVLSGFTNFKEGDEIECYSVEMKQASL